MFVATLDIEYLILPIFQVQYWHLCADLPSTSCDHGRMLYQDGQVRVITVIVVFLHYHHYHRQQHCLFIIITSVIIFASNSE